MIAGVDEAGRGPLAGPVVAASVILGEDIPGLNDSKALSEMKRQVLFSEITQKAKAWSYGVSTSQEIDRINIRRATLLAMRRAVLALKTQPTKVLIDGRDVIDVPYPCEAIIKGDQSEPAIMAASIIAKTIRDAMMRALCTRYPQYGFSRHAGYPTKQHKEAIVAHGRCVHHRFSFG